MLGDVIVCASVQALDPVFHPSPLGQHQHGQARLLRPQITQDADTVQLWQVQVKDDDVVLELRCCRPSLFAIWQNIHRVMFAFETLANESG